MSLPIAVLDNAEKWACHQCGYCCRGSLVPLSAAEVERLRSQKWEDDPDLGNVRIMVPYGSASRPYRLAHRPDGSCVFLMDDGLCRIHAKFGMDAKPTVCQTFPLQLVPHDTQAILTARRACPTAAGDVGRAIAEYLPAVKKLVRNGDLRAEAISPPLLKPGESRNWKTIGAVLDSVGGLLQDQRYPPVRRLVHALQFVSLLERAKTRRLSDAQIVELAGTLAELAPDESKPFFSERRAPKAYAKILFRLMAIDCARIHPQCRHLPKWSARLRLMQTAWKVVRGTGPTPPVDKIFPVASFEELEQPLGALAPAIYQPLARLMETSSASHLYAIADRQGWSVVECVRALALLYPVGLWLLRWLAHGREPNEQDMLAIVVALDRSQGHAPLSGRLHRLRLSTLSTGGELERLVAWYAQ